MSESSHPNTAAPPRVQFRTIGEIEAANRGASLHFFAPGLIRIRRMHVYPQVYAGRYFITSERPRIVLNATRRHTIREIKPDGSIAVVGDLQGHETFDHAERALRDLLYSTVPREERGHRVNGNGSAGMRSTRRRTARDRETGVGRDADMDWFDHSLVDELRRLHSVGPGDVVTPRTLKVAREPTEHADQNSAVDALPGQPGALSLDADTPNGFGATKLQSTIANKGRYPGDPTLPPLASKGLSPPPGGVRSSSGKKAEGDRGSHAAEMRDSLRLPAFLSQPGSRASAGAEDGDAEVTRPRLVRRLFGRRRLDEASITAQHRTETDVSDEDWFRRLREDLSKIER